MHTHRRDLVCLFELQALAKLLRIVPRPTSVAHHDRVHAPITEIRTQYCKTSASKSSPGMKSAEGFYDVPLSVYGKSTLTVSQRGAAESSASLASVRNAAAE